MMNGWMDRLRGARRFELYAFLALLALVALLVLGRTSDNGVGKTELEARMERILSEMDGVGRVSVMITQDAEGRPAGVVVVADRLVDVRTYMNLQSAVAKLLELELSRIEIIGRDGAFGGAI